MSTNGDDITRRKSHAHWWTENDADQSRKTQNTQKWTVKPLSLWCVFVQPPSNAMQTILPSGYILMVLQPLALCRYNQQTDAHTHAT